ncbi:hypothetical protein SAMN05444008_11541 [Cnuella takakiae]|uniref:Uncharacterized protein n=1 Tax=Cnuella takakiae TaxID=1302690 RepID=A0A1M5G0N5_9BACT|nr:hypothetical protein [Cnuella takakiae]OLY92277.1 hypothetical protein BUE76_10525 [Cnuella takakiae]SHF97021.1 hypothetical protein SAMN05444008_11541 [Cnuella takakiae]
MTWVIATVSDGHTVYIFHLQLTMIGGLHYIPIYTKSQEEAFTFYSHGEAQQMISKLRNPLERRYHPEPLL